VLAVPADLVYASLRRSAVQLSDMMAADGNTMKTSNEQQQQQQAGKQAPTRTQWRRVPGLDLSHDRKFVGATYLRTFDS